LSKTYLAAKQVENARGTVRCKWHSVRTENASGKKRCNQTLVSDIIYYVTSETLNSTYSLLVLLAITINILP